MAGKKVVTTNGKKGGNLVGKPHRNKSGQDVGGVKAVVTDANNRPVELEGGEVIINKEASKKHWKQLSKINQSAGGGVPINKPIDPHDEDPQEFEKGGKIEFNPNRLPNKWILKYAENIKKNHPEIWKKGGNIYGNEAFENLQRVSKRGYWLDSEEWFYIKWRSFVARHKGNFRIEGVVAMLKWVDKVDKGWQYMKNLIQEEIKKKPTVKDQKSEASKSINTMEKGGSIEEAMTLDEANSAFYSDNGYGSRYKWTTANFPKYIKHNGIVFEKGTPKKSNGLRKGQYIFSYYNSVNLGTDFWRVENFAIVKRDAKTKLKDRIVESFDSQTEMLKKYGVKTLDELDAMFGYQSSRPDEQPSIIFTFYAEDQNYDGELADWWYIYDNRWARGSGAENLSFIEYIPLMGDEQITVGSEERTEPLTHELEEELKEIPTQKISGYQVGDKGIYNGKKPVPIEISKITAANVYFINEETGKQKRSQKENFERLFMPSALTGGTEPTGLSEEEFIEHANKEIESWESEQPTKQEPKSEEKSEIERLKEAISIIIQKLNNGEKRTVKQVNALTATLDQLRAQLAELQAKRKEVSTPDYYNLFKANYEVMEYQNNEVVAVVLESFVKMVESNRLMTVEKSKEFSKAIEELR